MDKTISLEFGGSDLAPRGGDEPPSLSPRSYQTEMLEASLKRNIIVAMDTGSGKSLIAVLRIQYELERCPADQFIFVLVPTVALAAQWNNVISAQLPSVQVRFLSGADGVDRWRDQWIWDEVLANVRVVVCTYQILLDTLIHGFIHMSNLALIVFDEAHHCVQSHPANRIMRDFYHARTSSKPAILGLTASPVTKSKAESLDVIEANLNAIARTPKVAREELLQHVFQPETIPLFYPGSVASSSGSQALQSLRDLYSSIDIEQDPYVIKLRSDPATNPSHLKKVIFSQKTYCQEQMKSLFTKSKDIYDELGSWATDYYISAITQKFSSKGTDSVFSFHTLDDTEKIYLKNILLSSQNPGPTQDILEDGLHLSPKVQCLISFLTSIGSADFTGLVFVKTRAACAVLAHLLSMHVQTRDTLRISTFVGMSANANKKFDLGELVDVKNQKDTLDHLRLGQKNLVIATSALEEGIDVSACNLVVCFEKPPNLKSFIQRRGRARKSQSKYVLMFPEEDSKLALATWQRLEEEMRQLYMDEMRQLQELQQMEDGDNGHRELRVESTGAKITLEDAVQHLYHFCATLPADPYADLRPLFTFSGDVKAGGIYSKVTLPNSVDAAVRKASSSCGWESQKMARRDAAFEAYINLYHVGLVSDNLLPLRVYDPAVADAQATVQKIASLIEVQEQLNIWVEVASEWQSSAKTYASTVSITLNEEVQLQMWMLLPRKLPRAMHLVLYWSASTIYRTIVEPGLEVLYSHDNAAGLTTLLLQSVFRARIEEDRTDYVAVFGPTNGHDLQDWTKNHQGAQKADILLDMGLLRDGTGIVRDLLQNGTPHIFHGLEYLQPRMVDDQRDGAVLSSEETESAEKKAYLRVKKFPKRTDFPHPIHTRNIDKDGPGIRYMLASECEVDNLPFIYSQFALFIPSLLHVVEVNILAEHLCNNVLRTVQFNDMQLVITAISASAAQEPTNYQRLEFLGDSILKYLTSLTLVSTHLNWHEGLLSHQKDHIVSNANLARSALAAGLDTYILTKPFTGHKWRPHYISSLLMPQPPRTRQMSTKTLADVVESLIGAAYLDGGFPKALACLQTLLSSTPWTPIPQLNSTLHAAYTSTHPLPPPFDPVQHLLKHTFTTSTLLLEAFTHPSHLSPTSTSYQRLEFLGDALLDRIITATAYAHTPPIETHTLHLIRTALVNANFLAFLCMNFATTSTRSEIIPSSSDPQRTFSAIQTERPLPLWTFMRHSSPTIHAAQAACLKRYETLRGPILTALESGLKYPWTLLAALDAPKFFSDIVESVLGAIYIDTQGSWEACEGFLERLGMMAYAERVMRREGEGVVAVKHPKEEVGVVAGEESVRYELFKAEEEGADGDDGEGGLGCRVWVGEREVVCVAGGRSVLEVETRAAEEVVELLKREQASMRGARL